MMHIESNHLNSAKTGNIFVIFLGVTEDAVARALERSDDLDKLYNSYDRNCRILLAKKPTLEHEEAGDTMKSILVLKLAEMNIAIGQLNMRGHAEVQTPGRSKQPDASFIPASVPSGRTRKWPTFIVETAYTETTSKLIADLEWWLLASEGDVKTALGIEVHTKQREIKFQRREIVAPRRSPRWQSNDPVKKGPALVQQVVVFQKPGEDKIRVANGPLVIPFENVFLRQSTGDERDFVFKHEDLETIANMVWTDRG